MGKNVLAKRVAAIRPFRVMEIADQVKALEEEGKSVVHFEIGEPDFETASPIIEKAKSSMNQKSIKYTEAAGIFELREEISSYYRKSSIEVDPKQVIVTHGASGGLLLLLGGLLDAGKTLISSDPGYPCNSAFVHLLGARLKSVKLSVKNNFQPDFLDFSEAWDEKSSGLLLASPSNPTGAIINPDILRKLFNLSAKKNGFLIIDEIYQGIGPKDRPYSTALEIEKEIYVLNSFSKYFGMTGLRLGWVVVPLAEAKDFIKLAQHFFICPNTLSQYAATAAFSESCMEINDQRSEAFGIRLEVLYSGLLELGFVIPVKPQGAFYLFVSVAHTGMNSEEFAWRLLTEFGVAVTPAHDFSVEYGNEYVRFACSEDISSINIGLDRIRLALNSWGV